MERIDDEELPHQTNTTEGDVVKKKLWLSCAVAMSCFATGATAEDHPALFPVASTPIATVIEVYDTHDDPCNPPAHYPVAPKPSKTPVPPPPMWNLRAGKSQFKLERMNRVTHEIRIVKRKGEDREMEEPEFLVFNEKKPVLQAAACTNTMSYQNLPFAFAIHDLKDPEQPNKPAGPHALMYVPVWVSTPDSGAGYANSQFYLLIWDIKEDVNACHTMGSFEESCITLHNLWELKENGGTLTDLTTAIFSGIDKIRPFHFPVSMHNGVIHGNQ